jgi:hypothetical protein
MPFSVRQSGKAVGWEQWAHDEAFGWIGSKANILQREFAPIIIPALMFAHDAKPPTTPDGDNRIWNVNDASILENTAACSSRSNWAYLTQIYKPTLTDGPIIASLLSCKQAMTTAVTSAMC